MNVHLWALSAEVGESKIYHEGDTCSGSREREPANRASDEGLVFLSQSAVDGKYGRTFVYRATRISRAVANKLGLGSAPPVEPIPASAFVEARPGRGRPGTYSR